MQLPTEFPNTTEASFVFPGRNVIVSDRKYNEVLTRELGITEQQIYGTRLLSIGEGMSDFVLTCNSREICEAVAIDPIYTLVAQSRNLKAYEKKCREHKIISLQDKARFGDIKKSVTNGAHLPLSSFDSLPFPDQSFDIAVVSNVVDVVDHDQFLADFYNRFDEIERVVKQNGYVCCGKEPRQLDAYPKTQNAFKNLNKKGWNRYVINGGGSQWIYLSRGDIRTHNGFERVTQK